MEQSKTFVISLLLIISSALMAQTKVPNEPKDCYLFFEKLLEPKKSKNRATILANFKRLQQQGKLKDNHYRILEILGDELLKTQQKKTVFSDLLVIINAFANHTLLSSKYLDKWLKIAQKISRNDSTTFSLTDYLNWSKGFLVKNELSNHRFNHQWAVSDLPVQMTYEGGVLALKYDKTKLYCYHKKDSLLIEAAEGIYYPIKKRWVGTSGQVNWDANSDEKTYAILKEYEINTHNNYYQASNVSFYYRSILQKTLKGNLTDRIHTRNVKHAVYPIFESSNMQLKNIEKGVDLKGKLSVVGAKVKLGNEEGKRGTLCIRNERGQQVASIQSSEFYWLTAKRIHALTASIKLYIHHKDGQLDSIYHPENNFVYDIEKRTIFLTEGNNKGSKVAYSNSLQQMNMEVSTIKWEIDRPEIEFGDNRQNMLFYSTHYFNERLLRAYQGLGTTNPLIQMGVYGLKLSESAKVNPEVVTLEPWEYWIDASVMALLLDKRMERISLMTADEIQRAKKNRAFKIIERNQDLRDFVKGFPQIFKFAAMDVENLTNLIANSNFDHKSALPLYLQMVKDGFLVYNRESGKLRLRKKLFHYLASTNRKQKEHDYDRIQLLSLPSFRKKGITNGVLNCNDGIMKVRGVQRFILSDSQQVFARPFKTVDLLKDRRIQFDGQVGGGHCYFTGKDFNFNYDSYQIEMKVIDFIDFSIYKRARLVNKWGRLQKRPLPSRAVDEQGRPSQERETIQSVVEETKGLLLIDMPSNKSGRQKSNSVFPTFEATSVAKVYYNKRNRQGNNAYPRTQFYYELTPFVLSGMDDLKPENLIFDGKLYAADIFKPISEQLRVMYHDLSLGFETTTRGNEPNPIYVRNNERGKGDFQGLLGLSNEGLIGNGRVHYLGASIVSDYIKFLPDFLQINQVDSLNLEPTAFNKIAVPKVAAQKVQVHWLAYQDSMHLISPLGEGFPFQLFEGETCFLDGTLLLTPRGLSGTGTLDWTFASIESNPSGNYIFGKHSVVSASAAIILKASGAQKFGFENENVALEINFKKQVADFIVQEANLMTELPYISYQTSLDQFHWDMINNQVSMKSSKGEKGDFWKMSNQEDSLLIEGQAADYDLNTGTLRVNGVDKIAVADVFIYPNDKEVLIGKDAELNTLNGAIVIADTMNQYHRIEGAEIDVDNKETYMGKGFLRFDTDQKIELSEIKSTAVPNHGFVTIAHGKIEDTTAFYLDQKLRFKGNVDLKATSKLLFFGGWLRVDSSILPQQNWFSINSKIDKRNVFIQLDKPMNEMGEHLTTGLFLSLDTMDFYTTILNPKKRTKDRTIFETIDVFKFDENKGGYCFGDSAKVLNSTAAGDCLWINEKTGKVTIEGAFNFERGLNQPHLPLVELDAVGSCTYVLNEKGAYDFNTTLNIGLHLPSSLEEILVEDFLSDGNESHPLLYTNKKNENLAQHLRNLIQNEKAFEKLWKMIEQDGRLQLPKSKIKDFCFVNTHLVWSSKTQSFITKESALQLASIQNKHIGQLCKGQLELLPDTKRGDALSYVITAPNGNWYYFSYQAGILSTKSSNESYNTNLSHLKKKERQIMTSNGNELEIILGTRSAYERFKKRLLNALN